MHIRDPSLHYTWSRVLDLEGAVQIQRPSKCPFALGFTLMAGVQLLYTVPTYVS